MTCPSVPVEQLWPDVSKQLTTMGSGMSIKYSVCRFTESYPVIQSETSSTQTSTGKFSPSASYTLAEPDPRLLYGTGRDLGKAQEPCYLASSPGMIKV